MTGDTTRQTTAPDQAAADEQRPWYRHGWFWLIMIPPAWGVFAGLTLAYLALSTPNPLVVDDYSRIGRHTEARMERDREAARLGLSGEVVIAAAGAGSGAAPADGAAVPEAVVGREVRVVLEAGRGAIPPTLTLTLLHPTRDALDRTVSLHYDGEAWTTRIDDFAPSRYYLQLEPPGREWRLKGELGARDAPVKLEPPRDAHMAVDTAGLGSGAVDARLDGPPGR